LATLVIHPFNSPSPPPPPPSAPPLISNFIHIRIANDWIRSMNKVYLGRGALWNNNNNNNKWELK
jgi:hypothetical protein